MASYNTSNTTAAQSTNGVFDVSGVPIISTGNGFGASPLGAAARAQALYGIPNAQFNLLPIHPDNELANSENPLPYWSIENFSGGDIIPKSFFDTTTGTWSVELNPTAGSASDYITLTTRSFLLTDDNLALRQKAYLTMGKGTAYAGTTQFNVTLTAEYFDVNGTSLSSYAIGTALDNGPLTSISGITTSGSAAISSAAAYVDFTIKLTCTATVTSGVKVYLKSFFIQTSQAATGSFVIAQNFTSSGTFTVPTGVNYVTVVAIGAGQGGQGGAYRVSTANATNAGGAGGSTGYYAILRDINITGVSSISVGVGAGGAGGTAVTISKPAGSATPTDFRRDTASTAADGGDTTFGTYFTVAGARTAPSGFFGLSSSAGASGGAGGTAGTAPGAGGNGGTHTIGSTFTGAPYLSLISTANPGTAGVGSGGTGANGAGGTAPTGTAIAGAGGGGGAGTASQASLVALASAGGVGGPGGSGSGGGAAARYFTTTSTITGTAGNGGNAIANSGGGGGGGGGLTIQGASAAWTASSITAASSKGGDGGSGLLTVIYVA